MSAETKTPALKSRSIAILLTTLIIIGVGNSLPFALVPTVMRDLGLSELDSGLVTSMGALAFVLAAPFWGKRSDVWGRKPVIALGFLGYGLSFLLFGLVIGASQSGIIEGGLIFWALLLSRPIFLLVSSGTLPAAQAYIVDHSTKEQRTAAMGLFGSTIALGFILGPILGGWLSQKSILFPIYLVGGLALLASAIVWISLGKTAVRENTEEQKALSPFDPRIRFILLIGFLLYVQLSSTQQTLAFLVQDRLGLESLETMKVTGLSLTVAAIVMTLVQAIFIPMFKPHHNLLIIAGLLGCSAAFSLLYFADSYMLFLVAIGIFGAGLGMAAPGYLAAATSSVSQKEQGACAGLTIAAQGVAFIFGPVLGSLLYEVSNNLPYLTCALMSIVLPFVYLLKQRKQVQAYASE